MIHLLNLVFIAVFLLFAHFVDGPVTKALKQELQEVESARGDRKLSSGKKTNPQPPPRAFPE